MSEPSSTTSNAEIDRQTTCPAGGGGMAVPAASQLLDDGVGIASSLLLALAAVALATNIIVPSVWSTKAADPRERVVGVPSLRNPMRNAG